MDMRPIMIDGRLGIVLNPFRHTFSDVFLSIVFDNDLCISFIHRNVFMAENNCTKIKINYFEVLINPIYYAC